MADLKKELQDILTSLVEIPSVSSDFLQCKNVTDYVVSLCKEKKLNFRIYEKNSVYSLCISQLNTLEFDTIFLGHLDVVAGNYKDAFKVTVNNDWLFGRGAADMKGPCAAMIKLFLEHGNDAKLKNTALVLTTDEETGGFSGLGHLIKDLGLKANTVFNPDGPNAGPFVLSKGTKGVTWIEMKTEGIPAHASRPWKGKNAIEVLWEDINNIKSLFPLANNDNEDLFSVNVSQIKGGVTNNQVAESAWAVLDVRSPHNYDIEKVLTLIMKASTHSNIKRILRADPIIVDTDSLSFLSLVDEIKKRGFEVIQKLECGSNDARWFSRQKSCILVTQPECTGFHVENEAVNLNSLVDFYEIIRAWALR